MPIQLKRIYEPISDSDGYRVLIDRLWPRGVSKERAHLDEWMKSVAPSETLRKAFHQEHLAFLDFQKAYERELREDPEKQDGIRNLLQLAQNQTVTLLYAAKNPVENHALVLDHFLKSVRKPKVLIFYASEMGNTLEIAKKMAAGIRSAGIEPTVKDAFGASADEIPGFDAFLFGSGTIDDGELPDEAQDIYDRLDHLDLKGMPCAAFGAGDTSYELFCEAVNTIHKKLAALGADLIIPDFKVDFSMSPDEEKKAEALGKQFAETVWDRAIQKVS
jgi:flavodoxin short chain